ncbi:MAG: aldehyde dehydrogenase [Spongiibacteraceae bacterium]|jgi:acyl-CoA reductase-like NAD-dependent aldehyde dehydrogenase|nr:aldehyde dehydrogenase [Spongiibacteraceae bacterium]
MPTLLPENIKIAHPEQLFISGKWVSPAAGGTIEVISPVTGQPVARVAEATEADMEAAVAAAREAFDRGPWPTMDVKERAGYLRKMAAILNERHSELAAALTEQVGALASFAPMAAGGGTATLATYADIGENYEWVKQQPSATVPGHTAYIVREPVGVVAAIAPWNMPYAIMTQKIGPALISGCTVIMKPSPETPLEAYILAEAAEQAGLPAGVLNLVPAHREAADFLVRQPGVDKISFTGSTVAGARIASVAGERIARVTLELGGKSPAIMLKDFPIEKAAPLFARTITVLSGQVCAMLSRAIVPAEIHDELAEAIAAEMQKIKVGDPRDPATEMGPLAMERQLERVEHYVAKGVEEGARLVCGGKRPEHLTQGCYFEPTLFANVDNNMTIAREEIFGPVLCLIPAESEEHAIQLANETDYGLNSSVLTEDPAAVVRIGRRLRAGNVSHNGLKADFSLPFGGFKKSGVGREGGVEGILPYVETKTMLVEEQA